MFEQNKTTYKTSAKVSNLPELLQIDNNDLFLIASNGESKKLRFQTLAEQLGSQRDTNLVDLADSIQSTEKNIDKLKLDSLSAIQHLSYNFSDLSNSFYKRIDVASKSFNDNLEAKTYRLSMSIRETDRYARDSINYLADRIESLNVGDLARDISEIRYDFQKSLELSSTYAIRAAIDNDKTLHQSLNSEIEKLKKDICRMSKSIEDVDKQHSNVEKNFSAVLQSLSSTNAIQIRNLSSRISDISSRCTTANRRTNHGISSISSDVNLARTLIHQLSTSENIHQSKIDDLSISFLIISDEQNNISTELSSLNNVSRSYQCDIDSLSTEMSRLDSSLFGVQISDDNRKTKEDYSIGVLEELSAKIKQLEIELDDLKNNSKREQ